MTTAEPAVTTRAYHQSAGSNLPVVRIVIHATCPPNVPYPAASAAGQAAATARYFTSPASGGSAHYVCDVAGEEHCLPDDAIAWHAPPNPHSVGIEICGQSTYTRDEWLSPQVWPAVQRAAARTNELAGRLGVPARRLTVDQVKANVAGVCGHVDVSQAFHQSDHTDPGPDFPWDRFMAELATPAAPAPAPVPVLEEDDMIDIDPQTGGLWTCAPDGGVFAEAGARFLGSLPAHPDWHAGGGQANGPAVAFRAMGDGYTVFTRDAQGVLHPYHFPGDGSLK